MAVCLILLLLGGVSSAWGLERSHYDTCVCPGHPVGYFSDCANGTDVPTDYAPISGRPLNNSITGLCTSRHCCEYRVGARPQLTPDASTPFLQATQLLGTWALMAFCSVVGIAVHLLKPRLVRQLEHRDIRRMLLTLSAALLGAIGWSLGSDLLLDSTAIQQEAYGLSWKFALQHIMPVAIAVDAIAAGLTMICIAVWILSRRYIVAHALIQADFGAAKDRESLLDDMRKNIGAVTARLVKSMMAGILCTLLILITPQRILYDGVSAVVIQEHAILNEGASPPTPAPTQLGNQAKLAEVNLLVDVLMSLLMVPLFSSLLQNAAAAVNLISIFVHVNTELADHLGPPPESFVSRSVKKILAAAHVKAPAAAAGAQFPGANRLSHRLSATRGMPTIASA